MHDVTTRVHGRGEGHVSRLRYEIVRSGGVTDYHVVCVSGEVHILASRVGQFHV